MFSQDHRDSIVQRGIDEALACQDMLARALVKLSRLVQVTAGMRSAVQGLASRRLVHRQWLTARRAPGQFIQEFPGR